MPRRHTVPLPISSWSPVITFTFSPRWNVHRMISILSCHSGSNSNRRPMNCHGLSVLSFSQDMLVQYAQRAKVEVGIAVDQCMDLFLGTLARLAQLMIYSGSTSSFFRTCSSLCDHAPSAISLSIK